MRILWLGHNLAYPPKGGPLQRNYNLLKQASRRHEVHVLVFDQPASRPPGVTPEHCVEALSEFCASVEWVPLPTDTFGMGRYWRALGGVLTGDPYEFRWLRSREMAKRLQRLAGRIQFDVVHVDTLGLAPYVSLLPSVGTVLNHHDIESALVQRRAVSDPNVLWRMFWSREAAHLLSAERRWCPSFHVNLVVSNDEGSSSNLLAQKVTFVWSPTGSILNISRRVQILAERGCSSAVAWINWPTRARSHSSSNPSGLNWPIG